MYELDYMLTHDIDWFFIAGAYLIHAASNGGVLPAKIEEQSNIMAQNWVNELPILSFESDIEVNTRYIESRIQEMNSSYATIDNYKRTFVNMAMKGLISFDRDLNSPDNYIWIARPKKGLQQNMIPSYIFNFQSMDLEEPNCFRVLNKEILFG